VQKPELPFWHFLWAEHGWHPGNLDAVFDLISLVLSKWDSLQDEEERPADLR
jgi:hypothetical protein